MTNPDEEPQSPISELAAGMIGFHEFYTGAIEAGFNEQQAFLMTLELLRNAFRQGS